MDNTDVKGIVNDEIKKFAIDKLDKEMAKIMHNKNSATRAELITTIGNSMEAVFKVLWQKREFWRTDIR